MNLYHNFFLRFQVNYWKILSRNNPAQDYPSDFDLVVIDDTSKRSGVSALEDHPIIKSVTAQQMVHRTIKFVNYDQDEEEDSFNDTNTKHKRRKRNPKVSNAKGFSKWRGRFIQSESEEAETMDEETPKVNY